tara:strand:+ start:1650 stop:1862 length:213 start_codon:yes stop_codon:yes gene_type:complete
MRRFFLIALTAGLLLPAAAKAGKVWLVIDGYSNGYGMEKIEVDDMQQCQEQGVRGKPLKQPVAQTKDGLV